VCILNVKHIGVSAQFPDTVWFNAVLLRGYKELYKLDSDRTFINAFEKYAVNIPKDSKKLIDQAALLEIYSSLAK